MTSEAQEAQEHREEAARLPDGDLVAILLRQHADITDSMERIKAARGENRANGWTALTTFLKAHETAEQEVVHPISRKTASDEQAEARLKEEREADEAIVELTRIGPDNAEFGPKFAEFADDVHEHAEREEHEEFPTFDSLSSDQRIQLGSDFLAAFKALA
jgi:hypothetical protein